MKRFIVTEYIGIIFGISSGILSLMGLVAIFISLNTQHKIEKSRELLWDMDIISKYDKNIFSINDKIGRHLYSYKRITGESESIVKNVIWISKLTIFSVIAMWTIFSILVDDKYNFKAKIALGIAVSIGSLVLMLFYIVISNLGNTMKVGKLDGIDVLLDANSSQIRPVLLAAKHLHLFFADDSLGEIDWFSEEPLKVNKKLILYFSLPINNISIKLLRITPYYKEMTAEESISLSYEFEKNIVKKEYILSKEQAKESFEGWINNKLISSMTREFIRVDTHDQKNVVYNDKENKVMIPQDVSGFIVDLQVCSTKENKFNKVELSFYRSLNKNFSKKEDACLYR